MFEIKGLKYKNILDIPDLVLDRTVHCITGSSGSGKTTLLRHLNRLAEPDEGEIFFNDKPIRLIQPVELRRRVVMLGQTAVIYSGTVADNLLAGLRFSQKKEADDGEMRRALEQVNLELSLDAWCDRLSGGEKQRLCLARVLLMDAQCYLLDEPSAALDKENEFFVIQNMADFVRKRGRQLILVSHSDQVAEMFRDGLVRLEKGRVTEAEGRSAG